jgi:glutamyl/glutaminyl-tRNA synthetase
MAGICLSVQKYALDSFKEMIGLTGFGIQEERITSILKENGIEDGQENVEGTALKNAITQIIAENNKQIFEVILSSFDDVALDLKERFEIHMKMMHGM